MRIGKLDNETLDRMIIRQIQYRRPEVKVGAGVGEDCAVIDFGDYNCVVSTDPITGAVSEIGRLAVNVTCNDIASNGIEPLGILMTLLLPPSVTEAEMAQIMADAAEEAARIHVQILGGHTEVTPVVNAPVISSTAIGRQPVAEEVNRKAAPGDYILVTKAAGLEGTGIIAADKPDLLRDVLTEKELQEAVACLQETSVVREGVAAGQAGAGPMHDVTEGGILGALWEICHSAGAGASVELDKIPVRLVTRKLCAHLGLDPYRLISSGCMMIVARPAVQEAVERALRDAAVEYAVIGRITEAGQGMALTPPAPDELFKVIHQ